MEKWVSTGIVHIDMGQMVGQGDVRQQFEFTQQTATENAVFDCTFNIRETGEPVSDTRVD
jgi:hypothetical protein